MLSEKRQSSAFLVLSQLEYLCVHGALAHGEAVEIASLVHDYVVADLICGGIEQSCVCAIGRDFEDDSGAVGATGLSRSEEIPAAIDNDRPCRIKRTATNL